jgi:D-amino-acid dehydrogenase
VTRSVLVVGAGAVGASIAAHLVQRGHAVTLVDRGAPGEGTSHGNAGLIQSEIVYPTAFPQSTRVLLRYALNRSIPVHYHARALPALLPFLRRYAEFSRPEPYRRVAQAYAPIMAQALSEVRALADAAGSRPLLHPTGWMKLFLTAEGMSAGEQEAEKLRSEFAVSARVLDAGALRTLEPFLDPSLVGAVHYDGTDALSDPGLYVKHVARYATRLGARLTTGDAATLAVDGNGWRMETADGPVSAETAVIALGPWSGGLTRRLGYRMMLEVKRGYHMHFAPRGNAVLGRAVIDAERGFLLAPMARGIRLTTGIELADIEAPATPVQLRRATPVARTLFPLGEMRDESAWMGRRPCTPDMLPVIGPAPNHRNLWFAFGHNHHGVTLSAVTGRMIAEMIDGETPVVDPAAYRPDRAALG